MFSFSLDFGVILGMIFLIGKEGNVMDDFVRFIVKLAIAAGIGVVALLILFTGILVLAPDKLLKILYYGLILICIGAVAYIIFSLVRIGFACRKKKTEYGKH